MWRNKIKTPLLTVDVIINYENKIVVIERKFEPFGLALPGGFVEIGESVEEAVLREAKEETNLELFNLGQFKVYSDPARDKRMHTVSVVFTADGKGTAMAQDDAKKLLLFDIKELSKINLVFDHSLIIKDYLNIFIRNL